ncbi:TATA box-binding protein-associated factor RNA polymerase I subunit D [Galemys pyrenaicus]|uniref:TATA box-binding protein-associated factor RNA polymerase I subunit D n=1 Tax=Galemys pyrenaicus TaxID=202257 RepID=A0A8J6DUG3_GALPY|nr:TATA box-binding protein-associated factor RNA polymerase I subunit D [Galemys pyrenaicus]
MAAADLRARSAKGSEGQGVAEQHQPHQGHPTALGAPWAVVLETGLSTSLAGARDAAAIHLASAPAGRDRCARTLVTSLAFKATGRNGPWDQGHLTWSPQVFAAVPELRPWVQGHLRWSRPSGGSSLCQDPQSRRTGGRRASRQTTSHSGPSPFAPRGGEARPGPGPSRRASPRAPLRLDAPREPSTCTAAAPRPAPAPAPAGPAQRAQQGHAARPGAPAGAPAPRAAGRAAAPGRGVTTREDSPGPSAQTPTHPRAGAAPGPAGSAATPRADSGCTRLPGPAPPRPRPRPRRSPPRPFRASPRPFRRRAVIARAGPAISGGARPPRPFLRRRLRGAESGALSVGRAGPGAGSAEPPPPAGGRGRGGRRRPAIAPVGARAALRRSTRRSRLPRDGVSGPRGGVGRGLGRREVSGSAGPGGFLGRQETRGSSAGSGLFGTPRAACAPERRRRSPVGRLRRSPGRVRAGDSSSDSSFEPRPLTLKAIFERFKNKKKRRKRKYKPTGRPKGRPKGSRSRGSQIKRKQIKDKDSGFPFLESENGRKPLPWRKILTFEQAVARGFFNYLEKLKYEHHLKESLRQMNVDEDLEKDDLDSRRYKYLDDDGPISPIDSVAEDEDGTNAEQEDECDIKLVEEEEFIISSALPKKTKVSAILVRCCCHRL